MFYILYFILLQSLWNLFFFKSVHWLSWFTAMRVVSPHILSEIRWASNVGQQLRLLLLWVHFLCLSSRCITLLELLRNFESPRSIILIFILLIIVLLKLIVITLCMIWLISDYIIPCIIILDKTSSKFWSAYKWRLIAVGFDHRLLIKRKLHDIHSCTHLFLLFLNIELVQQLLFA